jgi:hypothetical protein
MFAKVRITRKTKRNERIEKEPFDGLKDFPNSFVDIARYRYEYAYPSRFWLDPCYDVKYFINKHRKEILNSLQVKDSLITKNYTLLLVTYRIDNVQYNESLWLHRVDEKWLISMNQSFWKDTPDPFGDGLQDGAREIIKRADKWCESNKGMWWY